MQPISFQTIDWSLIEQVEYKGETGTAYWKTLSLPGLRMRLVEYSAGYLADHWCRKGHFVYCLKGSFTTEMEDGQKFTLETGMSYIVSDDQSSHRSVSNEGATLLIVDGSFLQ